MLTADKVKINIVKLWWNHWLREKQYLTEMLEQLTVCRICD